MTTKNLISALIGEFTDEELEEISADLRPFWERKAETPTQILAVAVSDAVYGTSDEEREAIR